MRFFRRRTADTGPAAISAYADRDDGPAETGRRECSFCGSDGGGSPLTELRDTAYGNLHGYHCGSCEELYFQLDSRLTYTHAPGHRPWLVPDPGTEHIVKAAHDPFRAVHATVAGLAGEITSIPRAAARITALKIGVYGATEPTPYDSRDEAVAEVSPMIAEILAAHHATLKEHLNGREYGVHTLSLYGEGCGVLLREVTTEGDWLRQYCFPIDTDHSIHDYWSYDR